MRAYATRFHEITIELNFEELSKLNKGIEEIIKVSDGEQYSKLRRLLLNYSTQDVNVDLIPKNTMDVKEYQVRLNQEVVNLLTQKGYYYSLRFDSGARVDFFLTNANK